jgi:hypothetical protein
LVQSEVFGFEKGTKVPTWPIWVISKFVYAHSCSENFFIRQKVEICCDIVSYYIIVKNISFTFLPPQFFWFELFLFYLSNSFLTIETRLLFTFIYVYKLICTLVLGTPKLFY